MALGRSWPQAGAVHITDPVNTTLAANVFTGTPAVGPNYICVGVVEWAASAVVNTQDSADGLIGGASAPSYGIQLGWMNSGTFVAVDMTHPLPVTGGGGGVQYVDGVTQATPTGTVALGKDSSNVLHSLKVDNTGALLIPGVASNNSVGPNDTAAPTSSTQFGVTDGVDLRALRTPAVFKTIATTGVSAPKAIWTPTSGKKFRLMRIQVQISANAYLTSGGMLTIYFSEGPAGADIGFDFNIWIPPLMANSGNNYLIAPVYDSAFIDLGNGYLAAAANTTLYVQMDQVLTAGLVTVNVMGTEE